jgi:hypothetical protein
LLSSAALWAAVLLIAASIAGLWFLLADRSLGVFFLFAVPLALSAVIGILRRYSRTRDARRFRAALEAYANWEIGQQQRRKAPHRAGPLPNVPGVTG